MADVAFLVYRGTYKQGRRKRSDFDGQDNVGAYVVRDVLERAGIPVGFCTAEAAHHYKVILISFTSPFDVLNFLQSAAIWKSWEKRKRSFITIAGGTGLQNIYPLRDYVDYAAFGRAEGFVTDLVESVLHGSDFHHPSVMPLREEICPVVVGQAEGPYPYPVKVGTHIFNEQVIGCPLKCGFCHYSFSRKWIGGNPENYIRDGQYVNSVETLFKYSADMQEENPQSRIITGLDGFSERLRYAFNKRISNDTVIEVLEKASRISKIDPVYYKLYMIGNYPSETSEDFDEFIQTLKWVQPKEKRLMVMVHLTPFYSSPMTPAAYLPVSLTQNYRKAAGKTIIKNDKYKVWWSKRIESEFSHLVGTVLIRATGQSQPLINALTFDQVFRRSCVDEKLNIIKREFDIDPYVREYMTWEQLPTWYLKGYFSEEYMVRAAKLLKKKLGMEENEGKKTKAHRIEEIGWKSWAQTPERK